ncbi:MAG: CDGSH iron-sulfur domain-containing protein [Candidatus ainarchaeum sp.]|nr:CDGSH iron-sulfur domain-containing protein [Candidatus ainarchaeum sp.]
MARNRRSAGKGADSPKIKVLKNGPYLVSGGLPLGKEIIVTGRTGVPVRWEKAERYPDQKDYALCRCGHSTNKPYCTGKHSEIDFDGTETANRKKYLAKAEKISGPKIVLRDAVEFCALARFCERGISVWGFTQESDDPKKKKTAIQEAHDCPAGRLVMYDRKTGKQIEPDLKPSISIVEDPGARASGPIWVKGGVPVESSKGIKYEIRNRVTLCRCGKSGNKPFCDGTHINIGFRDGDKRVKR